MSNPAGYLEWLETGDHHNRVITQVKVLGVLCPQCNEAIWSLSRHDFRECGCGASFVDGGRDYLRYGTNKSGGGIPPPVWINVETGEWELVVYEVVPKEGGDE